MQLPRDNNHVPVKGGASNADGVTIIALEVDPTNHYLQVSDGSTGSDLSQEPSSRDENHIPGLMGVSSADGVTPVPIYLDSITKKLLVDLN